MLKLQLFGRFSVEVDGRPIEGWPRRDAAQLLKLLAVQVSHCAPRQQISEALWLETDAATRPESRLNNALYVLRKALEPGRGLRGESRYVSASRETIALNPEAELWIDIDQFERLLDIGLVDQASTAELTQAVALYRGPLLPSDEGQPWSSQPRQHLEQRYIGALRALSRRHRRSGHDEAAIGALQRLTRALPTEEASHRELIELFVRVGRQAEAQRQFEQCRAVLASDLGVAPDASTRDALRLVRGDVAAAASNAPTHDTAAPAAPAISAARFAPPLLLQALVDREREVELAGAALRSGRRLVTLTGPAGVGKTQLAIRLANELCSEFEEGACFVSLSEITDPSAVAGAVGRALGLKQTVALTWEELLKRHAAQRRVLLVLDNFEHLLGAAPLVSELIAAGGRLSIVCTSRAALNVAGETVLSVPPLQLPPSEPRPLHEVAEVASVALFVQRAQAAEPGFRMTDANAASIVALSHRLDGLPLAIELAAARVKLFGTEELQRRLESSFDLLHRGRRDSPERHHSLQAVLQWGYQLLPREVQHVFNRLGLFAGSISLASARGVLDDDDGDAVADALELLLEHHLIALADPAPHDAGERRYRMLQTVRAFALDQLRRSPADQPARARFACYWVGKAERIGCERGAGRTDAACAVFEVEHGNFEAAVGWAAENDAATAHRFVAALAPFWAMRGFGAEGRRWVQAILPMHSAAGASPDAKASYAAAELLLNLGHYMEAMPHALMALKEARHCSDARRVVDSLRLVAHLHAMLGRWKQATSVIRQALQHAPTVGDVSVAACRNTLGVLLRLQGEYVEANECFEQALAQIDTVSAAMASGILFNLSLLARLRGDYANARTLCAEAVAHGRASRDLRKVGCVLVDYGELMLLTGSLEDGIAAIDEALEISKRVGDSFLAGCALQQKGAAAVLRGHAGEARECLEHSLRVHREACCGDQTDITLLWLMRACWLECSTQAAATTFDQLLRLGPKIRHYLLPSVLEEGARLLRHHGQLPQARLAIAHAHAMRERFTLLHTPVEAPAARAEAAALRAELGAVRWHGLAAEMPPRFEDDPLRLLEDSLAVVNA